jgi:hypothetical protein
VTAPSIPLSLDDPVNAAILAVSEDRLVGFQQDPIGAIAERSGVAPELVLERLRGMLEAGIIRRIRQTLLATNLASGALCAWQVPGDRLQDAFNYLAREDPFSGHVVIRSTDPVTAGSAYRLWTTLKVPQGYALDSYAAWLAGRIGAESWKLMPARVLFALGVGHVRRRGMEPGARAATVGSSVGTELVHLDERQWGVLTALKREFAPAELSRDLWRARAADAGLSRDEFFEVAAGLAGLGVIGRFSTFLEHAKELATGERVTRYNALFHWAVPAGMEIAAGQEVARHHIITHAYWREGGPEFANVNVMAVAHGMEKELVVAHKAAIDGHLREAAIAIHYTNVFWGGLSEIKPSEISPVVFRQWCEANGIDPGSMAMEEGDA